VSRRHVASNDDNSTLAAYLREISKIPRLNHDEERALAERIHADGDEIALTRLVESNLRFVVSYAKRYRGFGVSFLDLIHEGNLGLMEAARRFDPARNVKFITYAVWWVREAMMHVLSDQTRAFSFPPKLFAALHSAPEDLSLNQPIGGRSGRPGFEDEGGRELLDVLAEEHAAVDQEMIHEAELDDVDAALFDLDRKERAVMRLRYGFDDDVEHTLQEIGDVLHISRERVRQIESRAKEKLRRSAKLRSHLN